MTLRLLFLSVVAASLVFGDKVPGQSGASKAKTGPDSKSGTAVLDLALSFEANRGQTEPSVKFLTHGAFSDAGYTLFLTEDGAVFELGAPRKDNAAAVVRMKLAGAKAAEISGAEPLAGKVNYFIGTDPDKWITGAPTYRRVAYRHVYPGVDLMYYGSGRQLEYDFVVAPGADPSQIALEFEGTQPELTSDGAIQLALAGSAPLAFRKPVVYQIVSGKRKHIAGGYRIRGKRVQFALGAYDHGEALVIDPVLDYLTYLGGAGGTTYTGASQTACAQCNPQNPAHGVAVDKSGNLYLTGYTTSTAFPLANAYQSQVKGNANNGTVFVTEINPSASALVYSTYLGGSNFDRGSAIAVDSSGSAYVTGQAWSSDFPVTKGAYQTLCAPSPGPNNSLVNGCYSSSNAFVAKLAPGGGSLVYSTFLGGSHQAWGNAVAVDSQGRAYVAGASSDQCDSANLYRCFPETANALLLQSLYNSTINPRTGNPGAGFVAVLDPAGANLLYSTLYGDKDPSHNANNTSTIGTGVAVDSSGSFYLAGFGQDPKIPTTPGAFQPVGTNNQSNGGIVYRGFVAKFSPVTGIGTGASLLYGTYLGGTALNESGSDQVSGIAVDGSGNAYITGYTQSYDFPVTAGANNTNSCPATSFCQSNGFLTKVNPSGTGLVWSTLVGALPVAQNGGSGTMFLIGAPRVDAAENVYITGQGAYNYPVVNPLQPAPQDQNGGVFVTKYDPTGSTISFSTVIYSPSAAILWPGGIDVDSRGDIYVGGYSSAADLPVTGGVLQPTFGANSRAGFVAKITPSGPVPAITSVLNGASFQPGFGSGSWATIKGTNLSNTNPGRVVTSSEIVNSTLPSLLDGTSVTLNGKAAFVYYVSPTQLNVLAPDGLTTGTVSVVVTNNSQVSSPFNAQVATYSPAFLLYSGTSYAIASHYPDYSFVGNPNTLPGTIAAKPGDVLVLWGIGFGPTNPPMPAGTAVTGTPAVTGSVTVTVGGAPVNMLYAILSPDATGLYQIAIQLPASVPTGTVAVQASVGQVTSPAGVSIYISPQ